jgi:hypothetical protein
MSVIVNLLEDIKPGQLKPGETICPIFSRVEPVAGGFGKEQLSIKSILFTCLGKELCGMWNRCNNTPTNPRGEA